MKFNFLIFIWAIFLIAFTILSYSQIDLNLTFLNWPPYLSFQNQLIQLGYFNRNLNGQIFVGLFLILNIFYLIFIYLTLKNKLSMTHFKFLVFLTVVILFFSYNTFSRDIFNYIFDARIITKYHLNPYQFKALDFPNDDWIRFMHWTHRTYPYGPGWLILTIVPSFLGLGKFLITYFLFKLVFIVSFLLSAKWLYSILLKINSKSPLAALTIFVFNPLVLINSLVSPHLDLVMLAIFLKGLDYFLKDPQKRKNQFVSLVFLVISVAIKFVTFTFAPFFIGKIYKLLGVKLWVWGLFIASLVGVYLEVYGRGLQAWYLIIPLATLPLLSINLKFRWLILIAILSNYFLVSFLNFIFTGNF